MLGYQSKCSKLCNSKWATLSKWFSDPVSFCMKIIFLSKFAPRLDFWISLFQNFRLYSGTTFARWLWDSIGAGRKETLPNLAKFLQPSESKNAHFSFGRGDDLLGHLDRRPPLGEALETLESVVYENPVLVRLASVVIWGSSWNTKK